MTSGRTAIVTGGSRGIGAAISLQLARDGLAVIVNYVGNEEAADQVVDDIHTSGGKALAVRADVSNSQEAIRLTQPVWRLRG